MSVEEFEADDAAAARLQAVAEADPSFEAFRRRWLAREREVAARGDALWPAQHPFEHDPRNPGIHP